MSPRMVTLYTGDSDKEFMVDVNLLARSSPVFEKVFVSGMNPVSELKLSYMKREGLEWVVGQLKDGFLFQKPKRLDNLIGILTLCQEFELATVCEAAWQALRLHKKTYEYFSTSWNSLKQENFVKLVRLSAPWSKELKQKLPDLLLEWATHHSSNNVERDGVFGKIFIKLPIFQIDKNLMHEFAANVNLSAEHYSAVLKENARYINGRGHWSCQVIVSSSNLDSVRGDFRKLKITIPPHFILSQFEKPVCSMSLHKLQWVDGVMLPLRASLKSLDIILQSTTTTFQLNIERERFKIKREGVDIIRVHDQHVSVVCTVTINVPGEVTTEEAIL